MKNERGWVFFRMLLRQDLNFSNLTLETTIVTPLQFCFSDYMGAVGDSFCYLPVRLSSKTANRHFQKDCIKSKSHTGYCHTKWSQKEENKYHILTHICGIQKKKKNGIGDLIHTAEMDRDRCENKQIPRGKEGGPRWTRRLEPIDIHYWYYV